ncbi:MAG TPA: hypothetical protein VGO93_14610 [Candidatus Xenobia bacterium]
MIDTAEKATALPTLRTPEMVATLNALQEARRQGYGLDGALGACLGDQTDYQLQYRMADPQGPMVVSGTIGNARLDETWTFDTSGNLHLVGKIGQSDEALDYVDGPDGTHVDGSVGSVVVHERFQTQYGPYGPELVGSGTVGDQLFEEVDSGNAATLVSRGSVGDATTVVRDNVTASTATGESLEALGQVAGLSWASRQDFALTFPGMGARARQ